MTDALKIALKALDDKKAVDVVLLDISEIASFARYFLLCSGESSRQIQAIAEEVELRLKENGVRANHIEGFSNAEWILMDYADLVIHVFSRRARDYYDLERLWRDGRKMEVKRILSARATAAPRGMARKRP
jgi:ribosome-associated protein